MPKLPERRRQRRGSASTDIQVELTRIAFEGLLGTVILGAVGLAGATAIIAAWYHDAWLWHLTEVMTVLCGMRIAIVIMFQRKGAQELTVRSARRWELSYGAALVLVCCSLAASTVYNFRSHNVQGMYWATVGVFATASSINSRIALRPWIANSSGLVLLAALAYSLLRSPDPMMRLTVVILAFFALTYCASNRTKFAVLIDHIRTQRKLHELSEQDALTGLSNRRRFQTLLDQTAGGAYAILYLDLDRFKAINDTFGHAAGDALLKAVAERLRQAVRTGDAVARLGGDEFAILQYPDATEASAQTLAARITEIIARPYKIGENTMSVGVSVGICLPGGAALDTESAMKMADKALYTVKQRGGNSFSVAS